HNFGPGCRFHHWVKALPGWSVESPQPGVFVWTIPTGHTYRREAEPPLEAPVYDPPGYASAVLHAVNDAGFDDAGIEDAGIEGAGFDGAGLDDAEYHQAEHDQAEHDQAEHDHAEQDQAEHDQDEYDQDEYDGAGLEDAPRYGAADEHPDDYGASAESAADDRGPSFDPGAFDIAS
ncbi:MAG TPA: hypothetical protein VKB14_00855, partial [Actinomycetales bacterium]|nr:hypothetical protein [Actinomycetales bacterium]